MKKALCILLALALPALGGCTPTDTAVTTEASITYHIYYDTPLNSSADQPFSETAKNVFHYSTSGINYYLPDTEKYTNPNAPQFREFSIGNEIFKAEYYQSKKSEAFSDADPTLAKFAAYDEYVSIEPEHINAYFRTDTGELIFFLAYDRNNETDNAITRDDARKIATDWFVDLYGKEALSEYSLIVDAESSRENSYPFVFYKTINGIRTHDYVTINISLQGKLFALNAKNMGLFNRLENDITEKQVTNAETALLNSITSAYKITYRELFVDTVTGKCYLMVNASSDSSRELFYINVN